MGATYSLIASNVLTSAASSVTFSSIPQTYTDLVLRINLRSSDAGNVISVYSNFNTDTYFDTINYSETSVQGISTTSQSGYHSNYGAVLAPDSGTASGATANTFASLEFYIPNYTSSINKPLSIFAVSENNATSVYSATINAVASLWRNTEAINTIIFTSTATYVSGSSFYLYGIRNA